jgi:hypothetical protein
MDLKESDLKESLYMPGDVLRAPGSQNFWTVCT